MNKHPSFQADRYTMDLVTKIADRAMALQHRLAPIPRYNRGRETMTWHMDLLAAHNNCPLDLTQLLDADDSNFAHDVFGIRRHINRETGELENCFSPRFTHRTREA